MTVTNQAQKQPKNHQQYFNGATINTVLTLTQGTANR